MDKYLSYCFLYDDPEDLRCDFEIATDELASMIGLLRSLIKDENLRSDLTRLNELMYHINPSLRTKVAVSAEELDWVAGKVTEMQAEVRESFDRTAPSHGKTPRFVVPQGCTAAAYSHIIRNKCKSLVRLLYRHKEQGNSVRDILFDFINIYSGYFYTLALKLNQDEGVGEIEFKSRVYT
ncbi:MAG: ATP--cob(I)alamin adenosyltransferase [Spirochaetaceae bacterium]|jgi:ATP:cob(I)alamin adenosyltransferase|nr:ATP--cob(I)alamin adenosyltransferase [Spirochaetaceae bacterium]